MSKFFLLLGLFFSLNSWTQDPEFSQFYANPVYLNPALAGTQICPRLNMNYRNQWANISGAYVTNSVSYDRALKSLHGGFALMVTNDMAGKNTINWTTINLAYSYHLQINRKFTMLFGGQATWNQKYLDWSKLTFGDQIDSYRGFIYQTGDLPSALLNANSTWSTAGFFDVSAGICGFSENFYFGFAAKHLNTPNESLKLGGSYLPMRFTGHAGATLPFGGESKYRNVTSISPNIIYTHQRDFKQLNIGTYIKHGIVTAGVWWRTEDAFILTFGIEAGTFRLGYSYDLTISELTNITGGAHELSLGFNFPCKGPPTNYRTVVCPSF
jgi:type IX secretion system PorP/SprF family membrane protein